MNKRCAKWLKTWKEAKKKQKKQNLIIFLNPNQAGGGQYKPPPLFEIIIALEPNVGLTSDQAVNSSLSVVLRSKKIFDQFGP